MKSDRGFTLVEMLVALVIFALLAAAGVALLSSSLTTQRAIAARLDASSALARTTDLLALDFAQALPRVTQAPDGALRPALSGGAGGQTGVLVSLVRGGVWHDPQDEAAIAHVTLTLRDHALYRATRAVSRDPDAGRETRLIGGIAAVRLRYRRAGEWRASWPEGRGDQLPDAIELMLTRDQGAPLRLVFLVGSGGAR